MLNDQRGEMVDVRELTSSIASGDTEAFTHFFHSRFEGMYAEARRTSGRDESFCLDVVQDAMVRVIRSMKAMSTERRLRNWVRVVVQSCTYDRLRSELRRRRLERRTPGASQAASTDGVLSERLKWLRGQLAAQDEPGVRLLVMRYQLGWTLQRIGDAVGLRPGAVDGRLRRLTAGLRHRAKEKSDE